MSWDRYFFSQLLDEASASVAEIALQGLSDVLFAIDADEGVAEVALEAGARSVHSHILSVDFVVLVVFLLRRIRRAGDVIWVFIRELTRVDDRPVLWDRLLRCLSQCWGDLTLLRLVRLITPLRVSTILVSILVRSSLILLRVILIIVLNLLLS